MRYFFSIIIFLLSFKIAYCDENLESFINKNSAFIIKSSSKTVNNILGQGKDILFDIDWQGTQQLMNNSKDDLVKVFVLPPSIEELERRLKERKQDKDEIIQKRMSRASDEMSHYAEYDYILVNDNFDETVEEIISILNAERLKNHRQIRTQKIVKNLRNSL